MKNIKWKFLGIGLILYIIYTFYIQTEIYKLSYPYVDDWNIDYIYQFHPKNNHYVVISNPPKNKLDFLNFIISKSNNIKAMSNKTAFERLEIFEEKWYFNRFFTIFYLDDCTIEEAMGSKFKDNNKKYLEWNKMSLGITNDSLFIVYNDTNKDSTLLYYPKGKYNNYHWVLNVRVEDSLTGKLIYKDLIIKNELMKFMPKELFVVENKEKWKNIFRK